MPYSYPYEPADEYYMDDRKTRRPRQINPFGSQAYRPRTPTRRGITGCLQRERTAARVVPARVLVYGR